MSGGVDSTAAAIVLKEKGCHVVGLTLKLWDEASRCCNYEEIMAAKNTCWKLGIKHYVLNRKRVFKKCVVDYFTESYLKGETPNPCAVCNEEVKFKELLRKMKEHNFDYVSTGHYANIEKQAGKYVLKKGKDKNKTQEYFLARLKQRDLRHIIFPLGKMNKEQARELVKKHGFNSAKKESQEVCFLKDKETPYEFIRSSKGESKSEREKGWLLDKEGNKLKKLDYAYYKYTIGQRKGLNYSAGRPVYVIDIDAQSRSVIIGSREDLLKGYFEIEKLNMFTKSKSMSAEVKIRYLHKQAKAKVRIKGKKAEVTFEKPQFAVTPGQMAVIYNKSTVLGSGFII